jgi:hypothetical protein
VTVQNLSSGQGIEVEKIWVRTDPPVKIVDGERLLPTKLQPNETLRMWIGVDDIPAGDRDVAGLVVVKLQGGRELRGRMVSDVPLSGKVLMYPTQPPNEPS